ncbi:Nn.00g060740.m01.CDS01 [Neocucurbitaria sp. VM-36]
MDPTKPGLRFISGPGEFFCPPAGYQHPPGRPTPEGHEGVFLHDRTDLLKWSILDSPTTAQIMELNSSGEPQWRPLFGEPDHPLAKLPITEPPRSRMLIVLVMVHYWEFWQDACAEDDRPAPLLIENPDGQPITLAQFIKELHNYSVGLRDLIYEIEDRADSEHARLYCHGASGPKRKDAGDADALFKVHLASDIAGADIIQDELWVRRAQRLDKKRGPSHREESHQPIH